MSKDFEKKKINLDEEQVKRLYHQREEIELQLESTKIAYDALKKQIELDIPMRQIRRDLKSFEDSISRLEGNLKALSKQIRTKSITQTIPKNGRSNNQQNK